MRRLLLVTMIIVFLTSALEARHRQYGLGFSIGGGFPTGNFEKDPDPGFGFKGFFGFGINE